MVLVQRSGATSESQSRAIRQGIDESMRCGVRLIGDIATPPCDYASLQPNAPETPLLEIVSFAEVIGLSMERSGLRYEAALEHLQSIHAAAISAHAPYSTTRQAIQRCIETSIMRNRPLAMHVAESPEERELLTHGSGPLADALRSMGVWQDSLFPWRDEPFRDLIRLLGRCPSALLVHGNDLGSSDSSGNEIEVLKQFPSITVIYCPRTHAFFGHDDHPVAKLIMAGVPVALGTDSRASNPDLNLWREVQHVLNYRPDVDPANVIAMATINGANALMRPDVGRIAVGCRPGFGTVSTTATTVDGLYESFANSDLT
jgi:cytosine/adenosine deaminase-related metal-dependent hydrolase